MFNKFISSNPNQYINMSFKICTAIAGITYVRSVNSDIEKKKYIYEYTYNV